MERRSSHHSRDPHFSPHGHLASLCHSSPHACSYPNLASPSPWEQLSKSLYSPWTTRILPKMRGCGATQTFTKEAHTGTLSPWRNLLQPLVHADAAGLDVVQQLTTNK